MPQRDTRAYLADIVAACDAVIAFSHAVDRVRYDKDEMLRAAIERKLILIGEAVNQLDRLEPLEVHVLGDVVGIIKVRNILAHVYFGVNHDIVWTIVTTHIPQLRAAAQEWQASLDP